MQCAIIFYLASILLTLFSRQLYHYTVFRYYNGNGFHFCVTVQRTNWDVIILVELYYIYLFALYIVLLHADATDTLISWSEYRVFSSSFISLLPSLLSLYIARIKSSTCFEEFHMQLMAVWQRMAVIRSEMVAHYS